MFSNVMPWHEHGFGYYFKNFVTLRTYFPWIFLVGAAIAYVLYFLKDKPLREHTIRWIILALGYLLLISIPAVKLEWYDAPVYPFFAMILGSVFGHLSSKISNAMDFVVDSAFFSFSGKDDFYFYRIFNPGILLNMKERYFVKCRKLDSIKVFMPVETPEHRLQLDFYRKIKSMKTGNEIKVLNNVNDLTIQDRIIISQEII